MSIKEEILKEFKESFRDEDIDVQVLIDQIYEELVNDYDIEMDDLLKLLDKWVSENGFQN